MNKDHKHARCTVKRQIRTIFNSWELFLQEGLWFLFKNKTLCGATSIGHFHSKEEILECSLTISKLSKRNHYFLVSIDETRRCIACRELVPEKILITRELINDPK